VLIGDQSPDEVRPSPSTHAVANRRRHFKGGVWVCHGPPPSAARDKDGACWLAGELWRTLKLDEFWSGKLGRCREGTDWAALLQVSVAYRLISPGSEWKLHRHWCDQSAMGDLLGGSFH